MSTITNNEPWHVAMDRYSALLKVDRALLDESTGDLGEEWHAAHKATSAAVDRVIDTPAKSLAKAVAKLRIVIRHGHMDGPSDDLNDPTARQVALADTMRDGPWPLLRVLEDLERLLPTAEVKPSEALRIAAGRLDGWEEAERHALDAASTANEAGSSDKLAAVHLCALDALLKHCVRAATDVQASTLADLRHKHRILQVLTRCSRWGEFPPEGWEAEFIASVAEDAARLDAPRS